MVLKRKSWGIINDENGFGAGRLIRALVVPREVCEDHKGVGTRIVYTSGRILHKNFLNLMHPLLLRPILVNLVGQIDIYKYCEGAAARILLQSLVQQALNISAKRARIWNVPAPIQHSRSVTTLCFNC